MRRALVVLFAVLVVTAAAVALFGPVLLDDATSRAAPSPEPGARPSPEASGTGLSLRPPSPRLLSKELGLRVARARELAVDLDPAAGTLFEQAIPAALAEGFPEVAEKLQRELELLRKRWRDDTQEMLGWMTEDARALAKEGSRAAISRYREAIETARAVEDAPRTKALEAELEALRPELERRDKDALAERMRTSGGPADDGSHDDDEEVRKGFARLASGDASGTSDLIAILVKRARSEADADAWRAIHDAGLARRALEQTAAIAHDEAPVRDALGKIAAFELRCRLEGGGQAVRRGDGAQALALLDLGELTRLDGKAPADPKVLYLIGRALEADGEPGEALKHFRAAIGTASWLPSDAPFEVVRWLARCRAAQRSISALSPGVGGSWRSLPRARFTLFHERPGSAGSLAALVEGARQKALQRLGIKEPIRVQSKTIVWVYGSASRYQASGSAPRGWAIGHASFDRLEDGGAGAIVVFDPGAKGGFALDDVLVHEWTHILVEQHLRGERLPSWAVEGVASFCENEKERAARLAYARREGVLDDWSKFLKSASDTRYAGEDGGSAQAFYAQSLVAFETIARRTGSPAAALAASRKVIKGGDETWKTLGFADRPEFEKSVAGVLGEKK